MRILFIGNPIAGRGTARAVAEVLVRRLEERGHTVDVAWTTGPGDATRVAAERGRDVDCVMSAGGDGTLREVFAGLGDAAPVLPIALGTGNMMARDLGVPRDPEALLTLIESRSERRIDVGRVGETPFLAVVGVGFDAMVTRVIAQQRGGALGFRGYALPILRAALRYRAPRLRVRLDESDPVSCGFVIVAKIRSYGGIMPLGPRAHFDSGVFEVYMVSPANTAHLLLLGPMALAGLVGRAPGVSIRPARRVRIEEAGSVAGEDGVPVEIDGDYFGVTPVDVVIEPGAARVVAPAAALLPA